MRIAFIALAFSLSVPLAAAATPEEDYLAAREKGAATVKALEDANSDDAKAQAADQAALAGLQKRLIAIVGPVSVRGFSKTAKINLETLSRSGTGADMLDALAFAPQPDPQDASTLVVTTDALLARWLKDRAAAPDADLRTPTAPDQALKSNNFYTFAFASDAAFGFAGEIETPKPAGVDFLFAGLGRRAQIDDPTPLDRVVVALLRGGRAYIAEMPAKAKIPEYPACKPIWTAAQAKSEALSKAYVDGGQKDEKLDKASTAATTDGERAWLACEGQHAKASPAWGALKAQAADLAARLAGG